MNPDCLIPILEQGDLLTWVEAAAAVGGAWLGLFAVSKYLGKREPPRLALRYDEEATPPGRVSTYTRGYGGLGAHDVTG